MDASNDVSGSRFRFPSSFFCILYWEGGKGGRGAGKRPSPVPPHDQMVLMLRLPPPIRGMIVSRSVYMARHPQSSYMVISLLSLKMAIPKNNSIH